MRRKFVDTKIHEARSMEKNDKIAFDYHNKTFEERLSAAAQMIAIAYNEPLFTTKKVNTTIYSARKQEG